MAWLSNSSIAMTGRTSPGSSYSARGVDAQTHEVFDDGKVQPAVMLTEMVGNGKRRTRASITIHSKDFKELVKVMFEADRRAAIKAFAQVLNATA